jgi:uncharacterized protein YfdQ (DUF2303 family)
MQLITLKVTDMTEKTHYRKAFKSPYLSSADIVEPTVFTIKFVKLEKHKANQSPGTLFNTAYFTNEFIRDGEKMKPMILNVTNSKTMQKISNSHFIEDWNDILVTVYVDPNVKNRGELVEGLRLDKAVVAQRQELKQGTNQWNNAIAAYKRDGNLNKVLERVDISEENQRLIMEQANDNT